jgi:hypothetical protein
VSIPSAEDFAAIMERQRQEYEKAKPERVARFKAQILPTHIDQWPESLHALSVVSLYESFPVAVPERSDARTQSRSESASKMTEQKFDRCGTAHLDLCADPSTCNCACHCPVPLGDVLTFLAGMADDPFYVEHKIEDARLERTLHRSGDES